MKRFLLLFLLIALPFQMSWAAASSYCEHESGKAAHHFGHHEHQHHASGESKPVKSKLGMNDHDCGHCQHGTAAISSIQADNPSLPQALRLIPFDVHRYISHIPDRIPKPNWQPAI
jgi:hypothetical protein